MTRTALSSNEINDSEANRMAKKRKSNQKIQRWIKARKRYHLSHAQAQMARELGMNPMKLGKLDNHEQEQCDAPENVYQTPIPETVRKAFSGQHYVRRGAITSRAGEERGAACLQATSLHGYSMRRYETDEGISTLDVVDLCSLFKRFMRQEAAGATAVYTLREGHLKAKEC